MNLYNYAPKLEFLQLRPCDVVCVRSMTLLGWMIRMATRSIGEPPSMINHTGIVSVGGDIREAPLIEALSTVVEHALWRRYSRRKAKVAIFRPLNLTDADREMIIYTARGFIGRPYGYEDLAAHLADRLLFGAHIFRRFTGGNNPICSFLVSRAFTSAGYSFGVADKDAQPDDEWDFMRATEGKYYTQIRELDFIGDENGRN